VLVQAMQDAFAEAPRVLAGAVVIVDSYQSGSFRTITFEVPKVLLDSVPPYLERLAKDNGWKIPNDLEISAALVVGTESTVCVTVDLSPFAR
jgi:hypothetical protein